MTTPHTNAQRRRLPVIASLSVIAFLTLAYGIFSWFYCRIEVPPEHIAVLIAKTGEDPPNGTIIVHSKDHKQKGIQLDILKPGRHFRNPFFWDWELHPYQDIKQGTVGVLTRLYGETPSNPENALLVPYDVSKRHLKGIVDEVLKPGQYPINPHAYQVQVFRAIEIEAGQVGVVCNQVGRRPETSNTYLVNANERGVQKEILGQGAHYLNPYKVRVYPVDIRSQRLSFSRRHGGDLGGKKQDGLSVLRFPSSDGFEIEVNLTVEWSIDKLRAPEVFVRIGTGDPSTLLKEILHKTLIPAIRGYARLRGSQYPAAKFIAGKTRAEFQQAIFDGLLSTTKTQGIILHSVLVNNTRVPTEIAGPIREREVAKEERTRNKTQIQQAIAEQALAKSEEIVKREKARVLAETEKEKRRIEAENNQRVALIEQAKLLAVAKADLDAAKLQAKAILARGTAAASVIDANNIARSEPLKASVRAFSSPSNFASYTFAQRVAPQVQSIFAHPDGPFGQLFKQLLVGSPSSISTPKGAEQ